MKIQSQPPGPPQAPRPRAKAAEIYQDSVQLGASTSFGALTGYVAGAVVSTCIHNAGGSVLYTYAGPAAGAAWGGTIGLAAYKHSEPLARVAVMSGFTMAGLVTGDLIGHGLSALSGSPLYQAMGPVSGAIQGALLGDAIPLHDGEAPRSHMPTVLSGVSSFHAGLAAGVGAGALLTHLTGNSVYNTVAPILGGAAGALTGVALYLNGSGETPPESK